MPPVFGPVSPSREPLVVAGERQGDRASRPSQSAMTLASRPASRSSTTTRRRPQRRRSPAGGLVERVADGHALAGREAVGLDDDPRRRRSRPARTRAPRRSVVGERPGRGPSGRRPPSATSWQNALRGLDPGGRRASARRPRYPASVEGIGDAGRERRLGPDDDELGGERAGRPRRPPRGSSGSTAGATRTRGSVAIASRPGRDEDLVDARLGGQLPGQGVLAAAAADDQDPGRHGRAGSCAGATTRWRIGRQARSIVWVRSGPTDTSTIGTPACSSSAVT